MWQNHYSQQSGCRSDSLTLEVTTRAGGDVFNPWKNWYRSSRAFYCDFHRQPAADCVSYGHVLPATANRERARQAQRLGVRPQCARCAARFAAPLTPKAAVRGVARHAPASVQSAARSVRERGGGVSGYGTHVCTLHRQSVCECHH